MELQDEWALCYGVDLDQRKIYPKLSWFHNRAHDSKANVLYQVSHFNN